MLTSMFPSMIFNKKKNPKHYVVVKFLKVLFYIKTKLPKFSNNIDPTPCPPEMRKVNPSLIDYLTLQKFCTKNVILEISLVWCSKISSVGTRMTKMEKSTDGPDIWLIKRLNQLRCEERKTLTFREKHMRRSSTSNKQTKKKPHTIKDNVAWAWQLFTECVHKDSKSRTFDWNWIICHMAGFNFGLFVKCWIYFGKKTNRADLLQNHVKGALNINI